MEIRAEKVEGEEGILKAFRSSSTQFRERPFYTNNDIEQICNEALENTCLLPAEPEPIRIERFIEKRFKVSPTYDALPDGILGYTEFSEGTVRNIVVARSLADDASRVAERRLNTTLAHESGHGLLHSHLFTSGVNTEPLFGSELSEKPKILCRDNAIQGIRGYVSERYDGRWWEYQANLAIGSLLLPRSIVMLVLEPFIVKRGVMNALTLNRGEEEKGIRALVEVFDVNPIVAKIRMEALFPAARDSQLTL